MDINVRPARLEDASLIGWVMLVAGRSHLERGFWDIVISQPEDKCLTFLELLTLDGPRHMCYYTEFLVTEVDGKPVAALEGFDPATNGAGTIMEHAAGVANKMGLTEKDMAAGQQGLAAFMTCYPDTAEGAWVIEHVATLPEYRRMGVISKLLEAILNKGRQQGFRLAQVGFFIGNTPAELAYKKAGFKYHDEKRHPDFEREIGCPGIVRLLCNL